MAVEAYTHSREIRERRARCALISVGAETIGTKRVDQDEEHVHIVARGERLDVICVPLGPQVGRILADIPARHQTGYSSKQENRKGPRDASSGPRHHSDPALVAAERAPAPEKGAGFSRDL